MDAAAADFLDPFVSTASATRGMEVVGKSNGQDVEEGKEEMDAAAANFLKSSYV